MNNPYLRWKKAVQRLKHAGFNRNKIYCYVLIGDNIKENEDRCRAVYNAGAMPHAQLFRDYSEVKTSYSSKWRKFERMCKRPAATRAHMRYGTNYWDF